MAAASSPSSLERHLLDELRLSGDYERLAARADSKRAALAAPDAELARSPTAIEFRLWFFAERLRRPLPDDMDSLARELGFEKLADFDSALRREWIYLHPKV